MNPLSNSTFNFFQKNKTFIIGSPGHFAVDSTRTQPDNLENFHVSKNHKNIEFSLSSEEINLIREFPKIIKDLEEIDQNYKKILKDIGEDY